MGSNNTSTNRGVEDETPHLGDDLAIHIIDDNGDYIIEGL